MERIPRKKKYARLSPPFRKRSNLILLESDKVVGVDQQTDTLFVRLVRPFARIDLLGKASSLGLCQPQLHHVVWAIPQMCHLEIPIKHHNILLNHKTILYAVTSLLNHLKNF
jgi:hypothetical protein